MKVEHGTYTDATTLECIPGVQHMVRYEGGSKLLIGEVEATGRKIIVLLDGASGEDYELEMTVYPGTMIPLVTKGFKWLTSDRDNNIAGEKITILNADPNSVVDSRYNFENVNGEWGPPGTSHSWEQLGPTTWETSGLDPATI